MNVLADTCDAIFQLNLSLFLDLFLFLILQFINAFYGSLIIKYVN